MNNFELKRKERYRATHTGPENPAGKEGADRPGPRLRSGRMRPAGHRRTDVPGLDKRLAEEPTECYE